MTVFSSRAVRTIARVLGLTAFVALQSQAVLAQSYADMTEFDGYVMNESQAIDSGFVRGQQVDIEQLKVIEDSDITVYFVDEGAGYQNALKVRVFEQDDDEMELEETLTVFSNTSCLDPSCVMPNVGNQWGGVLPGQSFTFNVDDDSVLDFALQVHGGVNPNSQLFWSVFTDHNEDDSQHIIGWVHDDCQNLGISHSCLVIGYEDMHGNNPNNDWDYNDIVFVVDMGPVNIENLVPQDENGCDIEVPSGAHLNEDTCAYYYAD